MSELPSIALDDFKGKVRALRSTDEFESILSDIKDDIKLPLETSPLEMRAILIKATQEIYPLNSLNFDVVLMALGLLKGFNNHDGKSNYDGHNLVTERRIKFLKESSYTEERWGFSYEEIENGKAIEKDGKILTIDIAANRLGSHDGRLIDRIAIKIYEKGAELLAYVKANEKDYLEEDPDVKNGKRVILPELKNIRQKKLDIEEDKKETTVDKPKNPLPPIDTSKKLDKPLGNAPEPKAEKKISLNEWRIIAVIILCATFLVCALSGYNETKNTAKALDLAEKGKSYSRRQDELPDVESIEIQNKNVILEPGEHAYLTIRIRPDDIKEKDLEYTSSNPEIVTVDKNYIELSKQWTKDDGYEFTITVQKGHEEDKATITVRKPNDSDSTETQNKQGGGVNND